MNVKKVIFKVVTIELIFDGNSEHGDNSSINLFSIRTWCEINQSGDIIPTIHQYCTGRTMVLILDGNPEYVAHV